jgi:hypothetical protein
MMVGTLGVAGEQATMNSAQARTTMSAGIEPFIIFRVFIEGGRTARLITVMEISKGNSTV